MQRIGGDDFEWTVVDDQFRVYGLQGMRRGRRLDIDDRGQDLRHDLRRNALRTQI